ncbi:Lrp/AsnC family transcriptional regulator [Haladaptatus sp. CMAA 1911]|uniref:Lrp/AsnC family transcriptional regulator n=1 Tax=unclassified Haladaptatus TaxID=2622732 RepID=UPI003753F21A
MSERTEQSVKLDEIDLALLERVETDFDVSLEELAGELSLSKSAVHYRLNKLKDSGVIEGVTAQLNPLAFDLEMVAITDVSVTHKQGYSETIGEQLAMIDGVEQVYYTMGDTDFVVISRVQDRDQMNDLIDRMVAIEEIDETSSKFVMQEIENGRQIVGNMSADVMDSIID